MKRFLLRGWLVALSGAALFGSPCLPGNLQTFIDLGANGCQMDTVRFTNFTIVPGEAVAVPVDPSQVQVTPGDNAFNRILLFTLNTTANAGETFESFFRFSASGSLTGASLDLTSPTAAGDGAIVAILDVCPNGSFSAGAPLGCPDSPASLLAFAIGQSSLLSDSASFALSSSFDVFVDARIDGGASGSATLDSAAVGFSSSSVPEPSAGLLLSLGLSVFGLWRVRRSPSLSWHTHKRSAS